ncbi:MULTISPECIES: ATP-binding protein [unclassified Duganella]|uniref:ATP-binding protein n=1 Tax=unclassified Duganella TaxID=2636909 RepID=UPI000E3522A6|nr:MULTISPECIES: ATP-binding protein [unclassified Duganella]RFP19396.1 response regulator [Duganella sp. BJB475]RFP35977.1 response regulator [Duganella sp. BJB476]
MHRLELMMDSVSDAVVTIDARGVIEYVNRGATILFGYGGDELLGQNVSLLMSAPEGARHDRYIQSYLKTGQSRVMNHSRSVTGRRKDGTPVPLDLTLGQMMQDGEQKFTGIMRDVSEQRRLQQRADEANRAKSVFLATMSHEIRTPMNGILGSLELLGLSRLDREQRETVAMAEQSGRELLRILDDILDFSKIEAGRLELRSEPIPLRAQVVDKVIATYATLAAKKGLHLHSRVDASVAPLVGADPLRLRQILHNFVSNALKFTLAGSVELSVEVLDKRAPDRQTLRFGVRDTGIGIAKADQARLFKPFVQAEGDTTRRFGGTGLGLAICLGLADSLGGVIAMQSEPGIGTTMSLTLTLPVCEDAAGLAPDVQRQPAAPAAAPSVAEAERGGTLILVVDDHATNRNVLLRQLRALGYAAEGASDGAEALQMLAAGRHALLISDCQMPVMDGYALARAIRAGGSRLPIIACTANAFASDAARALEAGMDDYLAKPSTVAALGALLDRYLPLPSPPLDEARLAELTGGDAAVRDDILADFRNDNDADVAALRAAQAAGGTTAVIRSAHRICGAARMLGATALAEASAAIERDARSGAVATAPSPACLRFDAALAAFNTYMSPNQSSP